MKASAAQQALGDDTEMSSIVSNVPQNLQTAPLNAVGSPRSLDLESPPEAQDFGGRPSGCVRFQREKSTETLNSDELDSEHRSPGMARGGTLHSRHAAWSSRRSRTEASAMTHHTVQSQVSIMGRVMSRMSHLSTLATSPRGNGTNNRPVSPTRSLGATLRRPSAGLPLGNLLVCFFGAILLSLAAMWLTFELAVNSHITQHAARVIFACVSAGVFVFFAVSMLALNTAVFKPLSYLRCLAQDLKTGSCPHDSRWELTRSYFRVREVGDLLQHFSSLQQAVGMFTRYVPNTVVNQILRGEEAAMRLHVSQRKVTIMFSDIKGFTSIAEQLDQENLLFLLTRYFSVMTRITEAYEGVIAEILGDGLLIFWNTPGSVENHEAKACASALAMQRAVSALNREFPTLGLPQIAVRIGIHTGKVLTGNMGSETKMKFGCIGDPMNLAARLEGLCKVYSVSILCSSTTHGSLPADAGFVCRELDLVKVKGKDQATRIYEVINASSADEFLGYSQLVWEEALEESLKGLESSSMVSHNLYTSPNLSTDFRMQESTRKLLMKDVTLEQMRLAQTYEDALHAYQHAQFSQASSILMGLLKDSPEDGAAALLLERVRKSMGSGALSAEERANWTGVFVLDEK